MPIYDYVKSKNGHNIQVESAKRDGAGKNIENNYAKQNGYYAQLTAGLADNLTPYSEDSGVHQENPFISNGTGTNNNQEIVTVGNYALVEQKQGNSVVVNQLAKNGNFENTSDWSTVNSTISVSNNVATLTATTDATAWYSNGIVQFFSWKNQHTYLVIAYVEYSKNGTIYFGSDIHNQTFSVNANTKTRISHIFTAGTNDSNFRIYMGYGALIGDTLKVSNAQLIDLTQWFGSNDNIPADLLANPSHWSWYQNFGDYIAYNTGSLENANGVKLISTGRNLFDGELVNGRINTSGVFISTGSESASDYWTSKNYMIVVGGKTYDIFTTATTFNGISISQYDSNYNFIKQSSYQNAWTSRQFTLESNCVYIRFTYTTGPSLPQYNQITFSLYYTPEQGGEGYDKYYPYEEPTIVDTGSEVLRKAGSVKDYKTKDGVIHRVVGVVDLGTLNWNYGSGQFNAYFTAYKDLTNADTTANALCSKYIVVSRNAGASLDKSISFHPTAHYIYVKDSSYSDAATFKAAMSGVMLYYELAQETTEQGTSYQEALPINDYGMLYWLDENDNLVGIPQGAKIFFPVNYKGFVDDVYSRTDGDAGNLVIQSELNVSETVRDTVDIQLSNAIGGTLRQLLAVSKSIDFNNTDVVDLGTLTFANAVNQNVFYAQVSGMVNGSSTTLNHLLSTLYKTLENDYGSSNGLSMNNMELGVGNGNNYIYIKNTAYTDATAFKNAMKGVLLAYEKA